MRTYDPADRIVYVHLAQDYAAPAAPEPQGHEGCHRLPAGYANASLRSWLDEPRAVGARPALLLLPGGQAASGTPAPAASALRLAR